MSKDLFSFHLKNLKRKVRELNVFVLFALIIMCLSMMRICSEKCVVKQFHHFKTIIECTNLGGRAYYTFRLYGIA